MLQPWIATMFRIVGAAAVLASTGTVSAQSSSPALPAATSDEIVSGAKSCEAAVTPKRIDAKRLEADGWRVASVTDRGKAVDTNITFFSKGKLLLNFDHQSAKQICFITARLPDSGSFNEIAFAMDKALGVSGTARPEEPGAIYWFPQGHIVQLKSTGAPTAPAVRVAVGYRPEGKK